MWSLLKRLIVLLITRNLTSVKVYGAQFQLQSFLQSFEQFDTILCSDQGNSGSLLAPLNVKNSHFKSQHILLQCRNDTSDHFIWPYLLQYDHNSGMLLAVLFQPEDTATALKFLLQISKFYKKKRLQAYFVYFIISWPHHNESNETLRSSLEKFDLKLPLNSRCYIFLNGSESEKSPLQFYEFYSIKDKFIVQPVTISDIKEFARIVQRRSNFRGATITAVARREDSLPILAFFKDINGTEFLVGGLGVDMLKTISINMNFTLRVIKARGWISELPDGSVGGMGKQLMDNKADLTLQYSDLLEYRLRKLYISQPTYTFRLKSYFRKPPPSQFRNIYLDAFKLDLKVAISSSWILILISLLFISYYKKKHDENYSSESDDKIIANVILWAIGTACQKGWDYSPSSASLRIIVFCSLLSGLLYYTAYSASIVAIFSVEVNPFRGYADLVKRGFTIYGNDLSVASYQYVKDQAKKDGVSPHSRFLRPSEGMRRIETSQSAFLSSGPSLIPFALRANYTHLELCDWLTHVDAGMEKQHNVIYFQKYDPLQKFIGHRLTHWREKGLLFRQQSVYTMLSAPICIEKKREPRALGFQDLRFTFLVLTLGFILCSSLFAYEIISYYILNDQSVSQRNNIYFHA